MDQDERDEAIAEARISGTSSRALAKQYGCTNREIEEAIDRRLSYELDNRQKLRLVKLSLGRIEALILPFFEKAVKDKDVAAGTLCCKLEERLSLLLGLDSPTAQRVDVYQVEEQRRPSQHELIRDAVMTLARGPNWRELEDEIEANGSPVASQPTEGNGSSGPPDSTR
jgi:hypothetical protein